MAGRSGLFWRLAAPGRSTGGDTGACRDGSACFWHVAVPGGSAQSTECQTAPGIL